ncbi:MAG: alpha/beta hydrolase, partial [Bacteroidales bacterium]|nr:alpha/beta hydrolase [Bacteroidales bacterium]
MMTDKKIECLDVTINYIDTGKGNPMVFIHNGGAFYQIWTHQIEHFRHDYRVIAVDLPGFGESSESSHPYTLEYYYTILSVFLDKLGIDRMILVGNCIGSTIAIKYRINNPERVIKLIIMNICPGERLVTNRIVRKVFFMNKPAWITSLMKRVMSFLLIRWPVKNRFPGILFGPSPDRESMLYRKYVEKFKDPGQTRSRVNLWFESDSFTLNRTVKNDTDVSEALLIWGEKNRVADLR